MSLFDERNDNDESSEIPNEDAAAEQPDAASDPESEQFGAVNDTGQGDTASEEVAVTADDFDASADESFDAPDASAEFEGDFAAADTDASSGTMPLFDSSGNLPADPDAIWQAVGPWEAAAAAAPGDPRFVKLSTSKPRNDLIMIDRGPSQPVVWIDRATMTPVLYAGEPEEMPPPYSEPPPSEDAAGSNPGLSPPAMTVKVRDVNKHFLDALDARRAHLLGLMEDVAQERIDYEKWCQAGEDRAMDGDWT